MAPPNAARPAPDLPGNGPRNIELGGVDVSKSNEIATKNQASFTEDEESALESDRRFFGRFQERAHYIRPSCRGEIVTLRELGAPAPPLGCSWFSVVKKVGPGCRMRRGFVADAGLIYHDATEDDAAAIWKAPGGPSEGRP